VELSFEDRALELTVINPVDRSPDAVAQGGHGIVGMHERATMLGGTLQAGMLDGSFTVHARLPYRGLDGCLES